MLEDHVCTVSIGGKVITNLRFADNINSLASSEGELKALIQNIERTAKPYGMKVNANKMKVMMNSTEDISRDINVNNTGKEVVHQFKYLSNIATEKGSKPEVISRIAQAIQARVRLKTTWKDKNISIRMKIWLVQT